MENIHIELRKTKIAKQSLIYKGAKIYKKLPSEVNSTQRNK